MKVYFAPMEGFTDANYRSAHHRVFGGAAKYYIPFISPTQYDCLTPREKAAVLPENNAGVPAVPQVLANRAEPFLWAARTLCDMGYSEVNLNVGCPSGTVTAITLGGTTLTGEQVRQLLGLRSAAFQVVREESGYTFQVKGYGHGVGMSQYGANYMAKCGSTFVEILSHYYTGCKMVRG